jgi:hypothetical protein
MPGAWRVAGLSENFEAYCRLSHNRVLLVYSDGGDYSELEAIPRWKGYAQILDLTTGRRQRLIGFTRMLNRAHGTPGRFETSPDGSWLKWISYETGDGWPIPVVARLDGSRFQRFSQDKFSVTYWLDNHRWAEQSTRFSGNGKSFELTVHNVNHPGKEENLLLNSQKAQNLLSLRRNPPAQIIGFSEDYRSHGPSFLDGNYFDRYSHPISIKPIRVLEGMDTKDWSIEPRHADLAYLQSGSVRSAFRSKKGKSVEVESLWVRRADGSALHRVGYVSGKDKIADLQWSSDGKHLSFIYNRSLYRVAAGLKN